MAEVKKHFYPYTHEKAEKRIYKTYELDGIPYMPHYVDKLYVRPGYYDADSKRTPANAHKDAYLEQELIAAGAIMKPMALWKRKDHEEHGAAR